MQYTIEKLKEENPDYSEKFGIKQADVDKVNYFIQAIEESRNSKTLRIGDIVQYTDEYGWYYPEAHVFDENTNNFIARKEGLLCVRQNLNKDNINLYEDYYEGEKNIQAIAFDLLGYSVGSFLKGSEKYLGKTEAKFNVWGTHEKRHAGSLNFFAQVNLWEAKAEFPFYENFSTKDWSFHEIRQCDREVFESEGYVYFIYQEMGRLYFQNTAELAEYIQLVKGKEFIKGYDKGIVLWCYFDKLQEMDAQEWERLPLPVTTRKINGINIKVKIEYNDEKHIVTSYSFIPQ